MMKKIREAYEEALADRTFVDREQAAFNAADNAALAETWRKYGVLYPTMATAGLHKAMRAEATQKRIEAIGF